MANAFLVRPLPFANVVSYGTVQAGTAAYVANDYAGVVCRLACDQNDNEAFFRVDLGDNYTVDTVMAFGLSRLPTSANLRIWCAPASDPTGFVLQAIVSAYAGTVARIDGMGVGLWVTETPIVARYLQIAFVAGAGNPGQSVQVSRLVIGKRFRPAIGFEYGGQVGVRDLGSLDVSARAVLLRHYGKRLRTVSLNFPSLSKAEAEGSLQKTLEQIGNTDCIGLCTDPTPDPERQNRCFFGPLVGDLGRTWRTAQHWEWRANLLGLM